ncbi:hypothetical protein EI015_26925, partial [Escherichia coli]|nr:hypothetical protein [Escherichia coli]MQL05707.1 hypothetical protein [Escherichia coli]
MGSCAAPSAKGDDKFITTDYLQQCPQVYGLQMVTIPILASEHRADSLTVNHSRKVVPVWVSRVETIL